MSGKQTHIVENLAALEALYGAPAPASIAKQVDYIHPHYRTLIEAAPFAALATAGPGGLDVSPRGDAPGFIHVEDEKTLMLPDRRGNNRIDSLRNVLADPRVALLFLIPGSGNTLRVNGRAAISVDPALLERFAVDGKAPRTVLVVAAEAVFFQCARAILRSDLWNPERHVGPDALPSIGTILSDLSNAAVGGESYDRDWWARAKDTLY
jgi:PPOX class probable FMN-dependent enzyme